MREWYISGMACLIDQYIHFKSLRNLRVLFLEWPEDWTIFMHLLYIKLLDSAVTALFFF